jgi:outer membrane receptor for ferrienterochelin and colicins
MPFHVSRWLAGALLVSGALLAQESAPTAPPGEPPAPAVAPADPSPPANAFSAAAGAGESFGEIETIEVVARRLNEARAAIETQLGASVYTIDAAAISAMPGGENSLLNQAILQAPSVAQDSFGQLHVRGEHNGLQYRLNGISLPEGIAVFGQALDPRLIASMQLITGALPAEYGLRTAGIIDMSTKSGALEPGGSLSIYGGSHGTLEPSINYGGNAGSFHYYLFADARLDRLGIESPDGSADPLHDRTRQFHGFAYLEDVLDGENRLSLILSTADAGFQIPDLRGVQPALGYSVGGVTAFDSALLDETQREQTQFGILSWQHSHGAFDSQDSLTLRASSLQFTPDPVGDLLFSGIAQDAYKRNLAFDFQSENSYRLNDAHTLRTGGLVQFDRSSSRTHSFVLPVDASGIQIGRVPLAIVDDGDRSENIESVYLQDEWRWSPSLTFNYGARFDRFAAYAAASQLSPRVNLVWQALPGTTVHAGYARYFSPPPFELVGGETLAKFLGTSAAPAVLQSDTPQAERANYSDVGLLQNLSQELTVGVDSYFKLSSQLIDEGQFGAPIILTPFNYQAGRQYGVETSVNYAGKDLSVYANLSWEHAVGRGIDSAQFNFSSADLAYIARNYIALDHEQTFTASAGASYRIGSARISTDTLLGSGLRSSLALPDGTVIPNGSHLPYYVQWNAGCMRDFHPDGFGLVTARIDLINLLDRQYQIRNGTGVGVGAPQFGARRGIFLGLSKSL